MDIATLAGIKPNANIPQRLQPGDTVKVSVKVVEGDKERTQLFNGVVIRLRHGGAGDTVTVRRVSYGVGVERTFPTNSPRVEKIELVRHGKVRRAKLYYLRGLSARASRIKERRMEAEELAAIAAAAQAAAQAQAEAKAAAPQAPAAEEPKAKAPAAEPAKPKAPEQPKAEAPAAKQPKAEAPAAEKPAPPEQKKD